MAQLNATVIMFKNIDEEDFLHSYDGFPWVIKAGEKVPLQYPVGILFAKHLARKIVRRRKIAAGIVSDKDKQGKPINLYPKDEIEAVVQQIIVERIEQPVAQTPSEGELQKKRTEELRKKFGVKPAGKGVKGTIATLPPRADVDKKDVIKELKGRGIKFDPRAPKEELLKLVIADEAKG